MALIARLKRWLGYDTTVTYTNEKTLYEYEVTHVDDDVVTVEAHYYCTDAPLVKFYEYDEEPTGWSTGFEPNVRLTRTEKRILEGIKEIDPEPVARDIWAVEADLAEGHSDDWNDDWTWSHERKLIDDRQ